MDPSIKKKPEKPRLFRLPGTPFWICQSPGCTIGCASDVYAYKNWQRTRAALNKHEGK